jgi:hypothetical protein
MLGKILKLGGDDATGERRQHSVMTVRASADWEAVDFLMMERQKTLYEGR